MKLAHTHQLVRQTQLPQLIYKHRIPAIRFQ